MPLAARHARPVKLRIRPPRLVQIVRSVAFRASIQLHASRVLMEHFPARLDLGSVPPVSQGAIHQVPDPLRAYPVHLDTSSPMKAVVFAFSVTWASTPGPTAQQHAKHVRVFPMARIAQTVQRERLPTTMLGFVNRVVLVR